MNTYTEALLQLAKERREAEKREAELMLEINNWRQAQRRSDLYAEFLKQRISSLLFSDDFDD